MAEALTTVFTEKNARYPGAALIVHHQDYAFVDRVPNVSRSVRIMRKSSAAGSTPRLMYAMDAMIVQNVLWKKRSIMHLRPRKNTGKISLNPAHE